MKTETFSIGPIPAVLYGEPADRVWLFVHGKDGYKEEAADFAQRAVPKGWQVLGIDLPGHGARRNARNAFTPWCVVPELQAALQWACGRWQRVSLRANSIGAWFSMLAFAQDPPAGCLFVSPLLDMAQLIDTMMQWAGVTEAELKARGEIPTNFGETLSWQYLQYARANAIEQWDAPTAILYAGRDNLTPRGTVDAFAARFHAKLTVMPNGEHWFHTEEQLAVLHQWETEEIDRGG